MGWFTKLKKALGFARVISPELDNVLEQAEELQARAEDATKIAHDVDQLVDGIRGAGNLFSPGDVCSQPGQYVLIRDGQSVHRWSGGLDTCDLDCGDRYPPGQRRGDLWQRIEDGRDLFPGSHIGR